MPTGHGYSGTPLPRKLGITADAVVALLGAPADFGSTLGSLPDGVRVRKAARGTCDVIVLFARSRGDLERRFPKAHACLGPGGGLWVAYVKQSAGIATDVTQDFVRATGLAAGLVDNKICAIDATWSGLRFVRRRHKAAAKS